MTLFSFGRRSPLAALLLPACVASCTGSADGAPDQAGAGMDAGTPGTQTPSAESAPAPLSDDVAAAPTAAAPPTASDAGCTSVRAGYERITPSISVVIGASATMARTFGTTTRWEAVHDAVIGFVRALGDGARIGVVVVGGRIDGRLMPACAPMQRVAPGLGNLVPISQAMTSAPCSSPASAVDVGLAAAGADLSALTAYGPTHVVLVVDGAPSSCSSAEPAAALADTVLAVEHGTATTSVIAVSGDLSDADATRIAAGTFRRATDPAALTQAFAGVADEIAPCAFVLAGSAPPPSATIALGGTLLLPSDYDLTGARLVLRAAACQTLRTTSAPLEIAVPCGAR